VVLAELSIASAALGWLATFLVHSTLWIGGAWLLARRVESAAWRERLWRGSIAGGLLTSALVLALPGARLGWRWEIPASEVPANPSESSALDLSPITSGFPESWTAEPQSVSTRAPEASAPAPRSAAGFHWSWGSIQLALLGLWLTGATLSLAHLAWLHVRLGRSLRSRRRVADRSLISSVRRLTSHAGLARPPRLSTSTSLPAPVALARGEIVVPERALQRLGSAELESLLGHELAHLARRDPWWLFALNVSRRVLWLQPLLSLATARSIEAAEMRCDELAARWTRGELALARCLAEVATWIEGRPASRLLAGMAEQPSALVERVERLLSPRPASRTQGALVAAWLIGMLSALSCAGPKAGPSSNTSSTATAGEHDVRVAETVIYNPTSAPKQTDAHQGPGELVTLGYVFGDKSAKVPTLASSFEETSDSPSQLQDGTVGMADAVDDDRPIDEQIEQVLAEVRSKMQTMEQAHEATGETPGHIELELSVLLQRAEQLKLRRKLNPHVVSIHRDGSIVCCQQVLVPAGSEDDAPLTEHVRGLPTDLKFLRLQADGQASYALLHRLMKESAAPDVGITRFNLAVDGGAYMPLESSSKPDDLPNSINVSMFVGKDSNASAEGEGRRIAFGVGRRRDLFYRTEVSGHVGGDLQSLEAQLNEFHAEGFNYPVLIDAAPEARCSEVAAVCDIARKVGFPQIRFAVAAEER